MALSLLLPRSLMVLMLAGDREKSAVSDPDAKAEMQISMSSTTRLTMSVGSTLVFKVKMSFGSITVVGGWRPLRITPERLRRYRSFIVLCRTGRARWREPVSVGVRRP